MPSLPPNSSRVRCADRRHSFTHVQIDGDELRLRQIDLNGQVIDDWTMIKGPEAPASQPPGDEVP